VADFLLSGKSVNAVQGFHATQQQEFLRKKTAEVWQRIDAVVVLTVPTIFTPAYAKEHPNEVNAALGSNLAYVNLLDLSSVTVPVGFRTDGIPATLTLVAPAFCEWEMCRLAKMIAGKALSIKNQKLPQHVWLRILQLPCAWEMCASRTAGSSKDSPVRKTRHPGRPRYQHSGAGAGFSPRWVKPEPARMLDPTTQRAFI